MAYETIGLPISWPAAGDLSARQYYAVTSGTNGLVNTGSTTATVAIGVLQDDPNALNAMGSVMQQGVSRCVCYGGDTAINPGDSLTFGANGFAVKTTASGAQVIGRAQEYLGDATPAIIAVLVEPGQY
jgi:hypothetical protein